MNNADLRDWAHAIAHDIGMHAFKASSTWIAGFKNITEIAAGKLLNLCHEALTETKKVSYNWQGILWRLQNPSL